MLDLKTAVLGAIVNQKSDAFTCEKHQVYSVMDMGGCPICGETERIIKLLEEHWLPIADVEACIALIKGEK